jgi:DNA-binding NtrC family response regulator
MTATKAYLDQAKAFRGNGVLDCISKPFEDMDVIGKVNSAVQQAFASRKKRKTESESHNRSMPNEPDIVGSALRSLLPFISRFAASRAAVLISGESGTGKELLARTIHKLSRQKAGPFTALDCTQLKPGQEKSLLELAVGGSIFFKNISAMPRSAQENLHEFLCQQDSLSHNDALDIRVLTATQVDLKEAIKEGALRKELYYKLSVVKIELPPLRNRPDDILPLTQHLIEKFNRKHGKTISDQVSPEVLTLLKSYSWPDNVAEFQNLIERGVVLAGGDRLTLDDVRIEGFSPIMNEVDTSGSAARSVPDLSHGIDAEEEIRLYEIDLIVRALRLTGGHQSRAAGLLQMNPTTLNSKIKKYRIRS